MVKYLKDNFNLNDEKLISVLDETPLWSAPFGLKLLQYVDYKQDLKVLDIGTGTGFPITELAMRLGETCSVTGIDPWEAALERVKLKLKEYGITNTNLLKASAENLPVADNSIDLITSNNGINNVASLEKVLQECYRVAANNAQVLFTVNLKRTMIEFYDVFKRALHQLDMKDAIKQVNTHMHAKRMPLIELTEQIQDAGFDITQLLKDEFKYVFSTGSALLNHYFIKLAFMPDWKEIAGDKTEVVFALIEEELNRISSEKGKIELTIPYVLIEARKNE